MGFENVENMTAQQLQLPEAVTQISAAVTSANRVRSLPAVRNGVSILDNFINPTDQARIWNERAGRKPDDLT